MVKDTKISETDALAPCLEHSFRALLVLMFFIPTHGLPAWWGLYHSL